jgi:uncharacterized protein with FMN-binding domain
MPKRGLIALILSLAALRLIVAYEPPGGSIVEAPSVDPSVAPPTDTGGSPTPTKAPPAGGGSGAFRDGTYDGPAIDYKYGTAQIQIVVEGGAIVAVNPLQLPTQKGYTKRVTDFFVSDVGARVIADQDWKLSTISGATFTTKAYAASIQAALDQARLP